MELSTCPDFHKIMKRWDAFWHGDILDRPLVNVHVKLDKPLSLPTKTHASIRERWFDLEYHLGRVEAWLCAVPPAADNIPLWYPDLGPELCATVFGCELDFSEHTSYSTPVCKDIRQVMSIKPNFENPYWTWIRKATKASLERGRGKWITAMPDLHTNGDLLAGLRDPQNLCLDMVDDPDGVRQACEYVTTFFPRLFDEFYDPIAQAGQPSTSWAGSFHFGRSYATSCDFICMISQEMFQQAILPSAIKEHEFLERSIYHLDGPGALRHLDALLEHGKIDALQWVYGAGAGKASDWPHVYQKAQAKGKSIQVYCEDMTDARAIMQQIKPKGTWLWLGGEYTLAEINAFLADVTRWGEGKAI